ncbi:hypothetical protein EJ04DRAFT_565525 [Polyplosphaeria fusca]|uniref:Uncharacterized protein n=1 Tax=Polyplosphaeria fusca TaxID=682080 RepID=A0A9P4QY07_9PLEO|nr:hypothetical protein EJ04DRAFT_565525 [Polyplosphaeria fusca]
MGGELRRRGWRGADAVFGTARLGAFGMLTLTSRGTVPVVETYIILIFALGPHVVLVPMYIWRMFTGCNALWDPTRFARANAGRVQSVCNTVLLVMVLVLQLRFWAHQVSKLNGPESLNSVLSDFLLGLSGHRQYGGVEDPLQREQLVKSRQEHSAGQRAVKADTYPASA